MKEGFVLQSNNQFLPLYYQLKQLLIQMIDNEDIKPDEAIPSEPKLMAMHHLSRTTVRKAIDELVNEGYLYRIQGKGTFVKGRGFEQALIQLSGCSEDIKRLGLTPRPHVLEAKIITPSKRIAHTLGILDGEAVFYMDRIIYGDHLPINRNKSYIPYKYVPGIENHDFNVESLYKVLEKDYNIRILKAIRSIEAILANDEVAKSLEVTPGAPVLLFKGQVIATTPQDETYTIEHFEALYRSDQFKFYIEQHR